MGRARSTAAERGIGLVDPSEVPSDGSPLSLEIRKKIGRPDDDAKDIPTLDELDDNQWSVDHWSIKTGEWEFVGTLDFRPNSLDLQRQFPGRTGRFRAVPLVEGDDGRKRPLAPRQQYLTISSPDTPQPKNPSTDAGIPLPPGVQMDPWVAWMMRQAEDRAAELQRSLAEEREARRAQDARLEEIRISADQRERERQERENERWMKLVEKERSSSSSLLGDPDNPLTAMLLKRLSEPPPQPPSLAESLQQIALLKRSLDVIAPPPPPPPPDESEQEDLTNTVVKAALPGLIARLTSGGAAPPPQLAAPPPQQNVGDIARAVVRNPQLLASVVEQDPDAVRSSMAWIAANRPDLLAKLDGGASAATDASAATTPGRPRKSK